MITSNRPLSSGNDGCTDWRFRSTSIIENALHFLATNVGFRKLNAQL